MAAELSAGARRAVGRLRAALAGLFLLYAAANAVELVDYSTYYRGSAWELAAAGLFTLFAAALYARRAWLRAAAGYSGVLLLAQALVTPLLRPFDYKTLPPNLVEVIDVQGDGMPGIEGVQRITTDGRGYRVNRPVDYQRPAGLRVFAIGGSTTEDIHLDDRRTWTALLAARLEAALGRPVEMINTGLSGLRSPNHYATLEQIGGLAPDAVLFLLGANDWNAHIYRAVGLGLDPDLEGAALLDAHRSLRSISLRESLLADVLRRARRAWREGPPESTGAPRVERSETLRRRRGSLARPRAVAFRPTRVDPLYDRYLRRIVATCQERAIHCIFVTQPSGYSPAADAAYRASFWMTPAFADYTLDLESLTAVAALYNQHLMAFGAAAGVPVCDAAAAFEPSFRYFYDDLHLNAAGAAHMAEVLAPCVVAALRRE